MKNTRLIIILLLIIIMTSCGAPSQSDSDYEQKKQMIIDVLQTDEGKKAMVELLTDEKFKQLLVIESDFVKETITESLVSEKGKALWQELFSDPKFVKHFYKTIEDEQEALFKHLMNDATFQKQMITLLQNPEMNQQILKVLKSQQFRQHLEELIGETIKNPIYRSKLDKKEEKEKPKEEGGDKEEENKDTIYVKKKLTGVTLVSYHRHQSIAYIYLIEIFL